MSPPPIASAAGPVPREDDEALQDPESARRLVRLPWRTHGLRALPMVALGVLASMLVFGARVELHASLAVVAASLPLLVIHTIAVSASTYRLVRKVQRQNLRLDAFARRDALTGLGSRAHWLDRAAQHLEAHARDGRALSLVALDLDHFKAINDRHGHPAGDDVLRALADERFPAAPGLVATISHGVAPPPPEGGLRAWMEAADRALYAAKQAGRGPGAEEEDA